MCNKCSFDGFLSSDDIRTGYISGVTFKNKPVQYSVVDGLAVFEGCIILGTAEEMEQKATAIEAGEEVEEAGFRGVFITGERYRWPNGIVPYQIDPNLPNQERVINAIVHWQQKTSIRFVQRNSNNANQYPNYILFRPADGCWSYIGMQGGKQDIGLAAGCGIGATIHEIGHALGLWHEQSREDRDRNIQIHWENIEDQHRHNFEQHITDGDDFGPYDYDSIMHYPATAFSKNGRPTISTVPSGKPIGNRNGLSNGDIATIQFLYPNTARVLIYEHVNFQGKAVELSQGSYDVNILHQTLGNDQLSSLKVPAGMKVTLYEHGGFQGRAKVFTQDSQYVGDDFNDRTSSLIVETI